MRPPIMSTVNGTGRYARRYLRQDDGLILAAAKRATDMGWYDRAIYAADRTVNKHNYSYRYAMPHRHRMS